MSTTVPTFETPLGTSPTTPSKYGLAVVAPPENTQGSPVLAPSTPSKFSREQQEMAFAAPVERRSRSASEEFRSKEPNKDSMPTLKMPRALF